jgi:hypothetical protein
MKVLPFGFLALLIVALGTNLLGVGGARSRIARLSFCTRSQPDQGLDENDYESEPLIQRVNPSRAG